MKRLLRRPSVQNTLARLLAWYLGFVLATTRWTIEGLEHVDPYLDDAPLVVAFWHERLALIPKLWLAARGLPGSRLARIHVMVSGHRDGQLIGTVVRHFGMDIVVGSSSRGGAAGLRGALGLLGRGDVIAIAPDGPRGPRRTAAPGVGLLAALSGAPVMPCAAQTSHRRVLRSWDRMVFPLPFGRGALVCAPPIVVRREDWQASVAAIATAMTDAAERADRLCTA